jgi:iron(III) transport system ATP-binding protein
VLLFDEPLSNLDTRLRRQMREEIRELQRRLSLTVVYVTHDQAEAMAVSDRIVVMNKGGVAQEGAPRELYEQPKDVFVAGFMGEANRVRGTLRRIDDRMGEVVLGPLTLTLAHRGLPAGEVDVAIRPESIVIGEDASGLAGTVRKSAYLGGLMEYTIGTALGDLFVIDMAVDHPRAAGAEVGLRFANHGVVAIAAGVAPP